MIDRPVSEHLEVLRDVFRRRLCVIEGMREAQAFDGRLCDSLDRRRRLDAKRLEHRGNHVDRVRVLGPDLTLGLDAFRPVDDERVADATAIGFTLPAPERRIACERPAPRIVIEIFRPANIVDRLQVLFQAVRNVVEELVLVRRSARSALRACSVVRDEHDERVVEFAETLQEFEETSVVMVGVLQEPGEDFHHPGIQLLFVRGKALPLGHVGIVPAEFGILRNDAQLFLTGECFLAVDIPALIEFALVFVRPFLGNVVRSMLGSRTEIHEEWLVRSHLLGVGDEADRTIDEVLGKVIALFRRLLRLNRVVVVNEFRVILVRVAAEEAVVAFETATERPSAVGTGGACLLARGQVPLTERDRCCTRSPAGSRK